MPGKSVTVGAIIGSTLMALSLAGSYRNPARLFRLRNSSSLAEATRLRDAGIAAFSDGRYQNARETFQSAASAALRAGSARDAAMNWSNAGFAEETAMQYGPALQDLTLAKNTAQASGEMVPLIYALNNLASLYLQMGSPGDALRISGDALGGPAGHADAGMRAKLLYQKAQALKVLNRFPEAEPIFRQSLQQMVDTGDLEAAARGWANLGGDYLDANRYEDAEWALSESLRLVRTHRLSAAANVLSNLARLRGRQGKIAIAEHLFQEALDAHESLTPPWVIHYERGLFRLEAGEPRAALVDFREARRLAIRMRIDIVPADRDRVALENFINRIFEGLIDAGNQVAAATGDKTVLTETFDAAEQDRLWSLRALVPDASDWRSHLSPHYWELLARFQSAEHSLLEHPSPSVERQSTELQLELQRAEASAEAATSAARDGIAVVKAPRDDLPSQHVREVLDEGSVLLSFAFTERSSWLWVADKRQMKVYRLPARAQIEREVADFTRALQEGEDILPAGRRLYQSLFGQVPAFALARKRWLLEPDGPLYDLPFAALPVPGRFGRMGRPAFLIERVALQTIPGALLMEKGSIRPNGAFVGIGDPIFNGADARYRRSSAEGLVPVNLPIRREGSSTTAMALPRLPNTSAEVEACSRAWNSGAPQLLTDSAASIGGVELALSASPAIVHFATHIITAPGQFGSGLIALSLDDKGDIGLMGPKDIAAHRIGGALVVLNGCHSGQGETLPGSGPMGLTRAWIAAGARAVLATRWDVPDVTAQSLMVNFYRALRQSAAGVPALALREAQLQALRGSGPDAQPSHWAGYFLLSRI